MFDVRGGLTAAALAYRRGNRVVNALRVRMTRTKSPTYRTNPLTHMALGVYFSPKSMNTQQCDTCIRKLEAAGAGKPAGRLYHACFGGGDKLAVFDVWDSQQSFDRFGETLMPILKELAWIRVSLRSCRLTTSS